MPRAGGELADLSPRVTSLLRRVEARMASAPTVSLIKEVAGEAIAGSKDQLTAAEIRELAEVAISRAREIEIHATRLAALLTEASQ